MSAIYETNIRRIWDLYFDSNVRGDRFIYSQYLADNFDWRMLMENIIKEYGGVILAAAGAFAIMTILGNLFAGKESLFARLLVVCGNGGF